MKIPVIGQRIQEITVSNKETAKFTVRRDSSPIKAEVRIQRILTAPISKNDSVGKVIFTQDGITLGEISLYPECDVTLPKKKHFFNIS
jgi:hypothetical protein